jgi:hypothetical protein
MLSSPSHSLIHVQELWEMLLQCYDASGANKHCNMHKMHVLMTMQHDVTHTVVPAQRQQPVAMATTLLDVCYDLWMGPLPWGCKCAARRC